MTLKFQPNSESYDSGRRAVTFKAFDGDKAVLCQVSEEALRDAVENTSRTKAALITAFRSRRSSIEAAAKLKYRRGLVDSDGRVTVQSLDLTRRR
jgi:outer membrane receptor for monomeric catechols